jgi:hypothetical protein
MEAVCSLFTQTNKSDNILPNKININPTVISVSFRIPKQHLLQMLMNSDVIGAHK